jgi:hypothetical protein
VGSLFSAISGKFSTALILGTFFPVTVFVFLARVLWVPLLPGDFKPALLSTLSGLDDKWELLILTLTAIVLSGLLYNLNIPLMRLYEGYQWKETWIGRRKVDHHRAALRVLLAKREGLFPLQTQLEEELDRLANVDPNDAQIPQLRRWIAAAEFQEDLARREVFAFFPKVSSVLPTRLGNAIRSFENYPERQYNMAAIEIWPRLISVVDTGYAETIDAAKAGVDFMLNSATLSALLALLLLTVGLIYPTPFSSRGTTAAWIAEIVALSIASWWFYVQSISASVSWGNLVRSAFDLFRGKLLEKLGYGYKPAKPTEERELWGAISRQLIGGDPPEGVEEIPPYTKGVTLLTSVSCTPDTGLQIARGVISLPNRIGTQVFVEVRYASPGQPVHDLVIVDTVPVGFDYEWDSATASEGEVRVEGTNPYRFRLSHHLAPDSALQLSYRIVPRVPSVCFGGNNEL